MRQIIDLRDTDISRCSAITSFNNCFIIRSYIKALRSPAYIVSFHSVSSIFKPCTDVFILSDRWGKYIYCKHKKKPRRGATLSNASIELKKVRRVTTVHNTVCDVRVKGVNPFSKHRANIVFSKLFEIG